MKIRYVTIGIIVLLIGVFILAAKPWVKNDNKQNDPSKEITFYYLPSCPWCQEVERDGTLEKIEELGFKVNKINANIGPIKDQFEGVPTFVIGGQVYSGYKTFEQIKELLGYSKDSADSGTGQSSSTPPNSAPAGEIAKINFIGESGEIKELKNGQLEFSAASISNQATFYNVKMPGGKIVYFFIVQDKNGIYRAAANGCQVCFSTGKGFHQEGDEIVCNNCGNRYPIEKIANEKGGCNPGPINNNLIVKNGKVVITEAELSQVVGLF